MQTIKLIISDASIIDGKILISKLSVIDGLSSETIRIAKVTPELLQLFKAIEIDLTDFLEFERLKKKNPNLKKLVDSFNLILT